MLIELAPQQEQQQEQRQKGASSMYHVVVVKKDEKTGRVVELVKDLGLVVAKGEQAAKAIGILACPKEVADGAEVCLAGNAGGRVVLY
jgi:hypothetical protein